LHTVYAAAGVILAVIVIGMIIACRFTAPLMKDLKTGKIKAADDLKKLHIKKLSPFGEVNHLSILPLIDFYADRDDLKTESGVSYLVRADDTTILLDMGHNVQGSHPSPLLQNMQTLGVEGKDIDLIFLSHLHLDHMGGLNQEKNKTFSISEGPVELREIPAYAPEQVAPSHWNPGPVVEIVKDPRVIKPGIASIGVYPRYLFMKGYTSEHSLAVNVKDKGIVLIIGCGHQTIENIIERVRHIFDEPVYAIIGGLHFPVKGGRVWTGPLKLFNIQHIVGSDNPPWKGLNQKSVENAINAIKSVNPAVISLSPHDSSDWSLDRFKRAFAGKYVELKAGREIII